MKYSKFYKNSIGLCNFALMKYVLMIISVGVLVLGNSCSGDSAYTEEEKLEQDSTDKARQEADFEKLENQNAPKPGDTAANSPVPDPLNNQKVAEPKVIIEAEEVK